MTDSPRPHLSSERVTQLGELQRRLGVTFPSVDLLNVALTHPSYLGEAGTQSVESNQRLEFLGDSVLGVAISEYLFCRYVELPEGELTKIKAAVVSEPTLFRVALNLGVGEHVLLGRGEETSGGRERPSVLADAFEALVGAILIDIGIDAAREFVLRQLAGEIEDQGNAAGRQDHKSRLQELTQSRAQVTPVYEVVKEEGPDHHKTFSVGVRVNGQILGLGKGSSKKEAEQEAARRAVGKLTDEPDALSTPRRK